VIGNGVTCGPYAANAEKSRVESTDKGEGGELSLPEDDDVDSDEEYLLANESKGTNRKYDDNYVPLYAKYPTIYACDG